MTSDGENTVPNTPAGETSTPGEPTGLERSRYTTVERNGQQYVQCTSAPNLRLKVERGLTVSKDAGRDRFARQSIFLDGTYEGGPLFDNELRHYSLDHHNGCIRGFTLATCEQAAVMLCQGLPLAEGDWQLYVNEPDLDALLAAWILLNHQDLTRDSGALLATVMPFVRVEGTIDAHGLDRWVLSGLPEELYREQKARIDAFLAPERQLKSTGQWQHLDMTEYAAQMLDALDRLLYPAELLDTISAVEVVAKVPIDKNGSCAFLCRGHHGIYAVETQLKRRFDKQVGVIVLDLGGERFTLRQVDTFLPKNLTDVYAALNERDDRVRLSDPALEGDGNNHWGGSNDIGGSPRKTGSALSGDEILAIVRGVFGGGGWLKRLVRRKNK